MPFISQGVAGATEYTAIAGAGLITFDLASFTAPQWVPRVTYLSLTLQGAPAAALVTVGLAGTAAANRAELINDTGLSFVFSCPLTLGKAGAADIHQIFVTTTGKTGAGLLEVSWFRSLRAALQSTTESFAMILAAFLVALALGGALASLLRRRFPTLPDSATRSRSDRR